MILAGYLFFLLPCIFPCLAATFPTLTTGNITLPNANLNSTSLLNARFQGLPLPESNAFLFVNYFDDTRLERRELRNTLGPARREAFELVARFGADMELQRRYKWASPAVSDDEPRCWFYVDSLTESLRKGVTYGIMKEAIEVLYTEMITLDKTPFASYIDILEGKHEFGPRIGEAVIEYMTIPPAGWDVASDPAESGANSSPFLSNLTSTGHLPLSNLTTTQSANRSVTSLTASESGPGYNWMRYITEGIMKITSEAPDAYLVAAKSDGLGDIWAGGTRNVADLHSHWVTCYVPDSGDYLITHGQVDPTTGEASWTAPENSDHREYPDPELHWLPDHDIAEAAAIVSPPSRYRFRLIEYRTKDYDKRTFQIYRFEAVDGRWWEFHVELLILLAWGEGPSDVAVA